MKVPHVLGALTIVSVSPVVAAGPDPIPIEDAFVGHVSQTYLTCHQEQGGGTFTEAMCLGDESRRQEVVLNAVWRRTIARLPASRANALRSDERRWIAGRDKRCDDEVVEYDVINSTAKLVWGECHLKDLIGRIAFLRRLESHVLR